MKTAQSISSIITEDKIKLKNEILEELKKSSVSTTGHGLPRIIESQHSSLKIIWLIFTFASIGLCAYMVIKSVNQYLEFGVNTQISIKNQAKIIFPAISICNFNPLANPGATRYLRNYYETKYNQKIDTYEDLLSLFYYNGVENVNDYLLYLIYTPNFTSPLNQTRNSFGFQINNMLTNCQVSNDFNCSIDNSTFEMYFDPLYGKCYKFNGNSPSNNNSLYTINRSGTGFYIEVFAGVSDILSTKFYQPKQKGIVVMIDDQDAFPIKKTGIIVRPGSQANIVLSKTTTENLPLPYSDCQYANTVDTLLSREMKRLGYAYTRDNCMVFCEQKMIIEQLGCYDARLPVILNAQPCLTMAQFVQIANLTLDFDNCVEYCPFDCKSTQYSASISYGDFPTWNYYEDLYWFHYDLYVYLFGTENFTYYEFQESFAAVRVYFDELKYMDIVDSPSMLLGDLIANIGGTMGLFVGVSVLSFVEIIELCINIFLIYHKKYTIENDISSQTI